MNDMFSLDVKFSDLRILIYRCELYDPVAVLGTDLIDCSGKPLPAPDLRRIGKKVQLYRTEIKI